jgi:hypothetical protein
MGAASIVFKCQATTEPGRYYDKTHVIGNGGAALIAPGQQKAWTPTASVTTRPICDG